MGTLRIERHTAGFRRAVTAIGGILLAFLLALPGAGAPVHADEAYTLVTDIVGEGTITITPYLAWYPAGSTVNLTIAPDEGWIFLRWNGYRVWPGGVSDNYNRDISIVMDAHKSVTAYLYKYDDDIIDIPDPNLEAAVLDKLGRPAGYDIRRTELATITHLNAHERGVADLTGLEYCTNLEILNLYSNAITDISPLAYCTELTGLHLWGNLVEDITPLVNNSGLETGTWITIYHNRLDLGPGPDMDAIQALQARGVSIDYIPQDTGPQPPTCILTTTCTGDGTILREPDQASYDSGTSVRLTAAPDDGWQFGGWGGALSGTENPSTIVITGNITATATFTEISVPVYSVTVTSNGNGTVSLDPHGCVYDSGTPVQITAVPGDGWSFSGWSGDLTGCENPAWITVTGDMTVTASFAQQTPPEPIGGGGFVPGPGGGGGGTTMKRYTLVSGSSTSNGTLWEDVTALSADIQLELFIPEGTRVLNANGYPLLTITVITITNPDNCPDDGCFIGKAYDLGPRGVTFDTPALLTLHYDSATIPEGVTEGHLCITTWNSETEAWEHLDGEIDAENNTITAELYHFSEYAVMASTHPAAFLFSPVTVTPASVPHDATATASLTVSNTGDLAGDCRVICQVDGKLIQQQIVTLDGGESREIDVTLLAEATGTHTIDVNGVTASFEVLPTPTAFALSDLAISPNTVNAGEPVSVSITVSNTGETGGDFHIDCGMNGTTVESRDVYIAAESSEEIIVTLAPDIPGICTIDINGDLQGTITVEEAVVIPEEEPDTIQPVSEPTMSAAEEEIQDTTSSDQGFEFRWWLAGGIILGLLIIGTIIVVARRNGRSV